MTKEDWRIFLLSKSSKEIVEMVDKHLRDSKDGEITELINDTNALNELDGSVKAIGIAKMNTQIESFKSNSQMAFIFTLFVAFITAYKDLLASLIGTELSLAIVVILISTLIFSFIKNLKIDRNRMLLAVFLKTLLEK